MSGNLHSKEFFALCARRLKPGGLLCAWIPTARTLSAFRAAFPHAIELDRDGTFVGSTTPMPPAWQAWSDRARRPDVVEYLGAEIAESLERALREVRPSRMRRAASEANSDLFPRDEFMTPKE
jgi:hypothetical protein